MNEISIYEWLLFLIPFTLLIVTNSTLFPFITGKALAFRALISVAFVFAIYFLLHYQNLIQKQDILFYGLLAYFLALLIGTLFSIDPYRSFWGNAERMEGLWSLFFYLLYPTFLIILFRLKPDAKKKLFFAFLIVSFLISVNVIWTKLQNPAERPVATLGNATYIGFFSLLMIFLILHFLFQEKNQILKAIDILAIAFNFLAMLFSETRGSILGFLAGIFIFFIYLIFTLPEKKKRIKLVSLFLLLILTFVLLLQTSFALKTPGIRRIAQSLQDPKSYMARIISWKIFLSAFPDKPIFGYGLETMPYVFAKHFDPKLFYYEESMFDRPHNKYIEMLISTGIVGFLCWFFFLITAFIWFFKSSFAPLAKASILAFFFAYLSQNFTLFDMQASYLTFFFGLALAVQEKPLKKRESTISRPIMILGSMLAILFLLIHLKHFQIVRRIITAHASEPKVAGEIFQNLGYDAGPFLSEAGLMAYTYFNRDLSYLNEQNKDAFVKILALTKLAAEKDFYNVRLYTAYLTFSTQIIGMIKNFGADYQKEVEKVKENIEKMISNFPNFPDSWLMSTQLYAILGEKNKALSLLHKMLSQFQYGPQTNALIGNVAYALNDFESAKIAYQRSLSYHYRPPTEKLFLQIVETFVRTQATDSLVTFLQENLDYLNKPQTLQEVKNLLEQYSMPIKLNLTK